MFSRASTAIAVLTASLACSAGASAQTVSIDILERISPTSTAMVRGQGVSDDGGTVVGYWSFNPGEPCRWTKATGSQDLPTASPYFGGHAVAVSADGRVIAGYGETTFPYRRASLWTDGILENLGTLPNHTMASEAFGVSADGKVVVGSCSRSEGNHSPFRWTRSGGMQDLGGLPGDPGGSGQAFAVNADGSVVVGWARAGGGDWHAFRWAGAGMVDLGRLSPDGERSFAYGVSADGKIVVGKSHVSDDFWEYRACRWTSDGGMTDLGTVGNAPGNSVANAVSANGRVIVGTSENGDLPTGEACIWIDGEPRQLWEYLVNEHGFDPALYGWELFTAINDCSSDGRFLTGYGNLHNRNAGFRITLPRPNVRPAISGSVADGATVEVREGGTLVVSVEARDADAGDKLKLEIAGLPPGATLTPPAGTIAPATEQAPFKATFRWSPGESDVGVPRDVTISFRDEMNGVSSLSFTIEVRSNDAPTVEPMTPVTIECVDGQHLVTLETTVHDPDGDPLTVTWKVEGKTVKTQNVADGATVRYAGNYEHGESQVELVVSDGILSEATTTTVTVADTQDPTIVVTPHAKLTTDPGKDFASKARLKPPTAEDATGHPVTFANDAPPKLPLGAHVVNWTATDIGGNEVTATQTVHVVDREKPTIATLPAVTSRCDPGKTFATIRLKAPTATDNVTDRVVAKTTAGTTFKIGTTNVVWTAKDEAGNVARKIQKVTVVNRQPTARAGRDVVVTTNSEKGKRVALDGSASSDADRHALKFHWTARKVRLAPARSAKTSGLFPIGQTTVKLTVTEAGGSKHTDTVKVTVRLRNGRPRPRGADANESFSAATQQAAAAIRTNASGSASLSGLAYANAATAYGDAAGGYVRWEEGQSEADALLSYAELRALQAAYGEAAVRALLSAYAESGEEALLSAYGYAAFGTAYAAADLNER